MSESKEPLLDTKLEKAFHHWMEQCPVHFRVQYDQNHDYIVAFFLKAPKSSS